jgi:hypothetical protein
MGGHIIDPRMAQITNISQKIGQATEMLLREEGASAFTFCFVMWQRDMPIQQERLIVTVPPGTQLQQLDDALRVVREELAKRKTG